MSEIDDVLHILTKNRAVQRVESVGRQWAPVIECIILLLIMLMAFFIRLFAVIRFESVIHEFDPHFNWRTTEYLAKEGFVEFWNWFDPWSWYPLGRVVGNTLFPGLMTSSTLIHRTLNFMGFPFSVRDVCVFFAPIFAGMTAWASYMLTKEVTNRAEAGLFSAMFMAVCPSYLSRSVAGSYDNEACAIFAIVFSFWAFIKAVKTGSVSWGLGSAFGYMYMVASWGGYVFVLNTVAIYVVAILFLGKFSMRHYVGYCVFYVVGTLLCLNIPFVSFQAITSSEHMSSHGVFVVVNVYMFQGFLREYLPGKVFKWALQTAAYMMGIFFIIFVAYLTVRGKTNWAGRSLTLLDPTYASKYIPIIASVSEHQPSTWANYVMDLHMLPFLSPIGLFVCLKRGTDASIFLGIYGVVAVYFSGMMIRLLLVLSAAACNLAGIGVSHCLATLLPAIRSAATWDKTRIVEAGWRERGKNKVSSIVAVAGTILLFSWCYNYITHATYMAGYAYSSPSIVMSSTKKDGTRVLQDDFREAYYWLRQNTHPKATVASWWDYGYQITSLANRTVIVDNNTWNNTHIATVALMLGSKEKDAYDILERLDVDYVLVLSGALSRYTGDDIAKFLWPVRIAQGVYPDKISEQDFLGKYGYSVGDEASEHFKNSVIYKLCYHRLAELTNGQDFARNQMIGNAEFTLKYFEEAFTTTNWIVRIYKVKKPQNRAPITNGINGAFEFQWKENKNLLN